MGFYWAISTAGYRRCDSLIFADEHREREAGGVEQEPCGGGAVEQAFMIDWGGC